MFVVSGRARDRTNPAAVLFEPESLRRRAPPRRTKGTDSAGPLEARASIAYRTAGSDPNANVLVMGVALRGRDGGDKPFALIASYAALHVRRLQGFPDGYTDIPWRGRPDSPDGPRYKAIGNSMAVPAMRWIGQRIAALSHTDRRGAMSAS